MAGQDFGARLHGFGQAKRDAGHRLAVAFEIVRREAVMGRLGGGGADHHKDGLTALQPHLDRHAGQGLADLGRGLG